MLVYENFFVFQLAFCLLFRIKIQFFVGLKLHCLGRNRFMGALAFSGVLKKKMIMSLLILLESKQQKKIRLGKSMLSI